MTNTALHRYLAACSDIKPTQRERLLRQSVSEDIVFINPEGESHGIRDLKEHKGRNGERVLSLALGP
jgi:hypothetical protein